jgi:hypothetical protein
LLFSGVLVKFDKLHRNKLSSYEFVPAIGDMMAARWSFEALAVEQFKNNRYERNFFKYNMEISQNEWYANYLINTLKKDLWECQQYKDSIQQRSTFKDNFTKLNFYISHLTGLAGFGSVPEELKASMNKEKFNSKVAKEARKYLDSLAFQFRYFRKNNMALRDSDFKSIEAKIGKEGLLDLKNNFENRELKRLVTDEISKEKSIETTEKIIQKYEPVYMKPVSKYGRAQFYAPYKQIGNTTIDTFWFNILVLWFVTLVLYIALYYNLLQKAVTYFENLQFAKSDR